jgi:hypothetical protein
MTQEKRFGLSVEQKRDMWRRWSAGESLHEIGHAMSRNAVCVPNSALCRMLLSTGSMTEKCQVVTTGIIYRKKMIQFS